jgi:alkylation response protein AidB-like acyl-CoA dehydrogenase
VAGIRTRAIRDGDDWLISGAKTYITNGIQADWLCLLLRTSDEGGYRGMSQVIVPTDTPGVTVSRSLSKLGNWCSDTAEFAFDNARVPVTNTIGEIGRGFQQQMEQFQTERICAVYQAVIQRLHEALDHEGEALADPLTCGRAHSEFHVLLVELSSSNTLALFARITADITTAHTNAVLEDAGGDDGQARIDAELAHRVHQKVAHLIEERDGAAAEAMWRAHMAETAEKMLKTQGAREVLDLIS